MSRLALMWRVWAVLLVLPPAMSADPDATPLLQEVEENDLVDAVDVQNPDFELAWERPLGPGYSSITLAGGRIVTMFSDAEHDLLAAFDSAGGGELWRLVLGPRYRGHAGSGDGPTSTPTVHDGTVYALSRTGRLVAAQLDDGAEVWSHHLRLGSEAREPHYGFATTPLVAGEVVVVQTGGTDGHSVSAFDRTSGEPRWSVEDDPVSYQSPVLLTLGSRRQIVAFNDRHLLGIAPETGEVLWRYAHGTQALEAFGRPQDLGAGRVLVNSLQEALVVEVRSDAGAYTVEEVWRSEAFGGSYSIPVLYRNHLFGFKGRFLSCVEASSGRTVWKSRSPGGKGLILVDGHLVVLSPEGEVVIAEASSRGYREKGRFPALSRGSYTPVTFADGRFFVRNMTSMAALTPAPPAAPAARTTGGPGKRRLLGAFGALVREVEGAEDPQTSIDEFLASHDTNPLLEGDDLVHFVYQGDATDVALRGSFLPIAEQVPMDRIAGTDVHFLSFRLDPAAVWQYNFIVDLGKVVVDPKNPHTVAALWSSVPASELRMPRWQVPDFVAGPGAGDKSEVPNGRLESFQFASTIRENTRQVRVYLPAGYERSTRRYPLAVIHCQDFVFDHLGIGQILDSLIGRFAAPFIAVLPPFLSLEEYGGSASHEYVRLLAEELVPHLDRQYRTIPDPGARAVVGFLDGGTMSLYAALEAPAVFGLAAAHSPHLRLKVADSIWSLVRERSAANARLSLYWTEHDLVVEDGRIDCRADSRSLLEALREQGYDVRGGEVAGSWGWGSWRTQLDDILGDFFPPDPEARSPTLDLRPSRGQSERQED